MGRLRNVGLYWFEHIPLKYSVLASISKCLFTLFPLDLTKLYSTTFQCVYCFLFAFNQSDRSFSSRSAAIGNDATGSITAHALASTIVARLMAARHAHLANVS